MGTNPNEIRTNLDHCKLLGNLAQGSIIKILREAKDNKDNNSIDLLIPNEESKFDEIKLTLNQGFVYKNVNDEYVFMITCLEDINEADFNVSSILDFSKCDIANSFDISSNYIIQEGSHLISLRVVFIIAKAM